VPKLMRVETYATVHQLVSTVTGTLRPAHTAIDAVQACFPPGTVQCSAVQFRARRWPLLVAVSQWIRACLAARGLQGA
jgi:hypothetical protein